MAIVEEQVKNIGKNKHSYIVTAFGEKEENTQRRNFYYGNARKVIGIPLFHLNLTPQENRAWQIPNTEANTSDNTSAYSNNSVVLHN